MPTLKRIYCLTFPSRVEVLLVERYVLLMCRLEYHVGVFQIPEGKLFHARCTQQQCNNVAAPWVLRKAAHPLRSTNPPAKLWHYCRRRNTILLGTAVVRVACGLASPWSAGRRCLSLAASSSFVKTWDSASLPQSKTERASFRL